MVISMRHATAGTRPATVITTHPGSDAKPDQSHVRREIVRSISAVDLPEDDVE
jgi:hypothetical protein